MIKKRDEKGWIPRYFGHQLFQVEGPNQQFKVDLRMKTCGCRRWELTGIPCVHAIAAYNKLELDPMDHVDDWYKVDTYLSTYDNLLGPINGRELWPTTDGPKLLPPDVKKRAGRPKKARRREPDEEVPNSTKLSRRGVKMTCRLCGKTGHNKRGCKRTANEVHGETTGPVQRDANDQTPVQVPATTTAPTPVQIPTTTSTMRCSLCGIRGHNKRGCKRRANEVHGQTSGSAAPNVQPPSSTTPVCLQVHGQSTVATDFTGGGSQSALTTEIGSTMGTEMQGGTQTPNNPGVIERHSLYWRGRKVYLKSSWNAVGSKNGQGK